MKESITKFDLESAFKALDEIEVPTADKVRANRPALTEIFSRKSKFDALMEEYYDYLQVEVIDKEYEKCLIFSPKTSPPQTQRAFW